MKTNVGILTGLALFGLVFATAATAQRHGGGHGVPGGTHPGIGNAGEHPQPGGQGQGIGPDGTPPGQEDADHRPGRGRSGRNGHPDAHIFVDLNQDGVCDLWNDLNEDGRCDGERPQPHIFIDEDGDGICDLWRDVNEDGKCDGEHFHRHYFVDNDGDGICDFWRDANEDGRCDGERPRPHFFTDEDGDGICDFWQDVNEDGRCDAERPRPHEFTDENVDGVCDYWRDANGQTGDDHGYNSNYGAPCCFNNTPSRPTDQIVKWQSGDKGMRVVHIHNKTDVSFHSAAVYCATLNADLCTKSQYVYLRTAGKITVQPVWPNDGEDTDGAQEYGTSGNKTNLANDMSYHNSYGFACCAGERTSSKCPAGSTDTGGVCWVKVHNSNNVNWINAARDCGKLGASICTVSQSSVLRRSGVLKSPGNWTAGFSDCDGQCSSSYGIGNASNNLNQNSGYGYACCL